jgi:hypothetical protein
MAVGIGGWFDARCCLRTPACLGGAALAQTWANTGWSFALLLLSSFFRFVVQPIITRRKAEGTWEVGDWELRTEAKIEDNNADEAIVICFDISYGMNDSMGSNWVGNSITKTFKKFDEAKQAFENVIARMVDYHLANHTGLVAFGRSRRTTSSGL